MSDYDIIVVGAGAAGLSCAVFAARSGARVLLVDREADIGGTLHVCDGYLSAADARRQKAGGAEDSADAHYQDIQRLAGGSAREDLTRIAVERAAWLVDWLEQEGVEFQVGPERTYRPVGGARPILEVFRRLLKPFLESGAVTLRLNTRVKALLTDKQRVVGVQISRGGAMERERAGRGVVLATGGFAGSSELFKEIEGFPLFSAARDHAKGDGFRMACGRGASVAGQGLYLPLFGGLPHEVDPHKALRDEGPLPPSKARPPHEIYVNRLGLRWIAEDEESSVKKQRALLKSDDLTFFTVFDDGGLESFGSPVAGWPKAALREQAGRREGVHAGSTIEELASVAGISAANLVTTIGRYNSFVSSQNDADFGRKSLPAPISKAPFYALRQHGVTVVTFAGVDVDERLRVRAEEDALVEGLYAAGEILGAGATSGQSYSDGMVLGPAIIFGMLIGERLGRPEDNGIGPTGEILRPKG